MGSTDTTKKMSNAKKKLFCFAKTARLVEKNFWN